MKPLKIEKGYPVGISVPSRECFFYKIGLFGFATSIQRTGGVTDFGKIDFLFRVKVANPLKILMNGCRISHNESSLFEWIIRGKNRIGVVIKEPGFIITRIYNSVVSNFAADNRFGEFFLNM